MVRELKEKDDGGTTGGLSSAGTPHNNFCVHLAVHFRQGGGVAGGRATPTFGRSLRGDMSVGVPHDSHQLEVAGVPLCVPLPLFVAKFIAIQHFCFESNKIAMRSEFHKAPLRQEKTFSSRLDRSLA